MCAIKTLVASFLLFHTWAFAGGYQHFSQGPISFAVPAPYVARRQSTDTECFVVVNPLGSGHLPVATVCLYPRLDRLDIRDLGFLEPLEAEVEPSYTSAGKTYPARKVRTPIGQGLVAKGVSCELGEPFEDQSAGAKVCTCNVALIQTRNRDWAVVVDFLLQTPELVIAPDEVFEKIINSLVLHRSIDQRRSRVGKK